MQMSQQRTARTLRSNGTQIRWHKKYKLWIKPSCILSTSKAQALVGAVMECRVDPGRATGVLACTLVLCYVLMLYCMCTGKGLCGQSGFSKGLIINLGLGRFLPAGPVHVIDQEYCPVQALPGDQCNLCNRLETSQSPYVKTPTTKHTSEHAFAFSVYIVDASYCGSLHFWEYRVVEGDLVSFPWCFMRSTSMIQYSQRPVATMSA